MIILPLTEIERSCSFIGNDKIVKENTGMFTSQYSIYITLPISYKKLYENNSIWIFCQHKLLFQDRIKNKRLFIIHFNCIATFVITTG